MKLLEFMDASNENSTGYYNPASDELGRRNLGDTRKPALTLRALNRLKKMRALRKLEKLKRQDMLGAMYAAPADGGGGPGGFGGF